MSTIKISQLPAASLPLAGNESVPMVQNGVTVKAPSASMLSAVNVFAYFTQVQVDKIVAGTTDFDCSSAIEAAIATSRHVYLPKGLYKCNIDITSRVTLQGDGSTSTIIKPWNDAVAAMTYKYAAMSNPGELEFWNYHSEIRDIGFYANSEEVGVGFAFSQTTLASPPIDNHSSPPALSAAGPADQYANNVKFYGCQFRELEKGVLFPDGNIGTEFYSCGFNGCYYGVYTISNKYGGDGMHAGNKYFYAGMFSGNKVGIYINNTSNYGGVNFYGTIFELNAIAGYVFNGNPVPPSTVGIGWQVCPLLFSGCWFEFNGTTYAPNPSTVTVDVWTGDVRTTTSVGKRSWIFEGTRSIVNFKDCGVVTDIVLGATNTRIYLTNCITEDDIDYIGSTCVVTGANSQLINDSPSTEGGLLRDDNITTKGIVQLGQPNIILADPFDDVAPKSRWWLAEARSGIQPDMGSLVASESFVTPYTLKNGAGTLSLTGSVVSDGQIFKQCNEFVDSSFFSSEYWGMLDTSFGTSAGWYAFTIDVKVTVCADLTSLNLHVWNQNQPTENATLIYAAKIPALNKWYTLCGYAYLGSPLAIKNMYFDMQGPSAGGTATTWRLSAFQAHKFVSGAEAASFLANGAYSHKGLALTGTGDRILADFSNATVANRAAFQSSTTNGATRVNVLPNGTSNTATVVAFNNSDPTNASSISISAGLANTAVTSGRAGSGTYQPLDFLTNGVGRIRIRVNGQVGIGTDESNNTVDLANSSLAVGGVYASDSNVTNIYMTGGRIPSTTTSNASVFHSNVGTAVASFTLTDLYHFRVTGVDLGAGSAVTNEYGFYSNIAAASGKWNLFATGTARNYFAGGVEVLAGTTTMAAGFTHIPAAAGAPTGAPTNPTGNVPMYYDSTNDKIYVYSGGTWRSTAALT